MNTQSALAAMLLAACTHPINIDPSAPDGLAERFELVAFYEEITGNEAPLRRWDAPIRAFVAGPSIFDHHIESTIRSLNEVFPYGIERTTEQNNLNLIVAILEQDDIEKFQQFMDERGVQNLMKGWRFNCSAVFYMKPDNVTVILSALVYIDADLPPAEIRRCLAQEITQTLGLPNDIDDPDGTVFSSYSRRETLSESDRRMVRILYDPRLTPGMTRVEAMPIVREIVAEFSLLNGQTSE